MSNRQLRDLARALGLTLGLASLAVCICAHAEEPCFRSPHMVLTGKEAAKLLVSKVEPVYPPVAKLNYIEGSIELDLIVSAEGTVTWEHARVGDPLLAVSALEAVRQWRYRPFMRAAGPVGFITRVSVKFMLMVPGMGERPTDPEEDLTRQIKPPEPPKVSIVPAGIPVVRARVLLDSEGKVVDYEKLSGSNAEGEEAERLVKRWSFAPARWGALAVPGYAEVTVPLIDQDTCSPKSASSALGIAPTVLIIR